MMARRLLAALLGAAALTACAMAPADERCDEATGLYDEAPSLTAGLLTFTACLG